MQTQLSRRSLLKLTGLAGLGAAAAGCSSGPSSGAAWAMWSSSPAERKVWEDFSAYVERELKVESLPTLTPSGGYPTKLDLQLVSGTAGLVTALNGWLIPTYAARGAHRPLDDLIAGDPDLAVRHLPGDADDPVAGDAGRAPNRGPSCPVTSWASSSPGSGSPARRSPSGTRRT